MTPVLTITWPRKGEAQQQHRESAKAAHGLAAGLSNRYGHAVITTKTGAVVGVYMRGAQVPLDRLEWA